MKVNEKRQVGHLPLYLKSLGNFLMDVNYLSSDFQHPLDCYVSVTETFIFYRLPQPHPRVVRGSILRAMGMSERDACCELADRCTF